ncbi:hypothetical protein AWB80_03815 [Caballeronia pedi]|uniref:Uncharacterized protein n=1 Tax=Caballeronia pedi TaxID=1777141 RepID=A0A158BQ12_9BURK|nr:hypothetical protein [Caballeronia pedi]SAK71377.1 hypothetical protein AWB80_03815 [Caballeronia pedi]
MAYGLECYDASGNPVLRVTDRITRYGGQFDTGTTAGSMTIPMFGGGTPWFTVRDIDPFSGASIPASVSISGNVISWTFAASSSYPNRSVRVTYGVY